MYDNFGWEITKCPGICSDNVQFWPTQLCLSCVHACSECMCVCICARAGVRACTRVRVHACVCVLAYGCIACVDACMCVCNSVRAEARTCTCAHACTFVCLQVHLSHRYVCVRARVRGCVHAHVRSESLLVPFLFLHHLCHGKLQWG